MSRRCVRAVVTLFAVSLATAVIAGAQILDRGEIRGTVRDQSGAFVSGVAITLRQIETGLERAVVTDDEGRYVAVLLPVGWYRVRAELQGFGTVQTQPVRVRVGETAAVDIALAIAALAQAVEVVANVEHTPVSAAVTLGPSAIEHLPINGRDYRDFALLAPTAQAITGSRGTFRLAGQPGDYLALQVDGGDFTNNLYGEFFGSIESRNLSVPFEAVEEFQVKAGTLDVEFGRSNGTLVNVVTKSGTNVRHGSGAFLLRHHRLTAADAFGNPPTGLVRRQFAGSLGGPLMANRSFFFIAAEAERRTTPIHVRFSRNVHGVAVPEMGITDVGAFEGEYVRQQNVTALFAKADYAVSRRHRLTLRTNFSRSHATNMAGGTTILARAPENLEKSTDQGISTVVALTSAVSDRTMAETKFQLSREVRPRHAQGSGPQIAILDTGTFGASQVLPSTQDMYRYQLGSTVSATRGRHATRAGGDYNAFNVRNNSFAQANRGAYVFPTLERFLARQPSLYTQNFGLGGFTAEEAALLASYWQWETALYLQDQFRVSPQLSVSYGLRYDAQFNPEPQGGIAGVAVPIGKPRRVGHAIDLTLAPVPQGIPNDVNNWGPRADVSYAWDDSRRTVLGAAAGLYFGRTPLIYFPLRGSGITSSTISAPPSAFGVTFPQVLPSAIAPGSSLERLIPRPSIQYVDPAFQNPRVFTASASLSHQLDVTWSIDAAYVFSDSRNLRIGGFRSTVWDRNLTPPAAIDEFGRVVNVRPSERLDPTIGQANALASFGRGRYHAAILSLRASPAAAWQFYANYVLSRSEGNGSTERDTEALMGPSDPFDLEPDYGLTELDQRHAFKAFLHGDLVGGVTFASIWTAGSGLAAPVYSAVDVNGDGVTNGGLHPDRPLVDGRLVPRFPSHQPGWFLWDLRVAKRLGSTGGRRGQLMAEAFNLLGTPNTFPDPRTNTIWGQPNFGQRNRTLGPRVVQLGVRFDF